ncbi:MAG: phage tail protein [Bacteroidales bacterium]|nr:phage tail protein [Bacteroidales bacterium]
MEDFSKEMAYGNFQNFDRFPLDCESMAMMQSTLRHYAAIAQIAGYDLLILSGCEVSGGFREEGYVFVKKNETLTGEILFHPKAVQQSTCSISEIKYNVQADGETFENAYSKRRLIEGGNEFSWSEVVNLSSVSNKALFSKLYSLSNSLSSEQSARDAAVQNLKETLLQELRSEVSSASSTAESSLSTEVTALNKRIADLESALSKQIENAQNTADTAADGLATTQFVNSQISVLKDETQGLIDNERKERVDADTIHTNDIAAINKSLASEAQSRASEDYKLSQSIDALKKFLVPSGTIVAWAGSPATIPTGWVLCDGSIINHTAEDGQRIVLNVPDLRNRFILGSDDIIWKLKGGNKKTSTSVTLTAENLPYHRHMFLADTNVENLTDGDIIPKGLREGTGASGGAKGRLSLTSGQIYDNAGNLKTSSIGVDKRVISTPEFDIMPPYYALCYIMKL